MAKRDFYEVLGVGRDADADTLKKAYRCAVLKYHPDRHARAGEAAVEEAGRKLKEANAAYAVLSDPGKRSFYDQFGEASSRGAGHSAGNDDWLNNMAGLSPLDTQAISACMRMAKAFGEVYRVYKDAGPRANVYKKPEGGFGYYKDVSHLTDAAQEAVYVAEGVISLVFQGPAIHELWAALGNKFFEESLSDLKKQHEFFQKHVGPARQERIDHPPCPNYDIETYWPVDTAKSAVEQVAKVVKSEMDALRQAEAVGRTQRKQEPRPSRPSGGDGF